MSPSLGVTAGVSTLVPHLFHVAIDGVAYLIDTDPEREHRRRSIPLLRNQADTAERPGEQSLSIEGSWRRSMETWHHGAGQSYNDRPDSDPARFRSSKGIDIWTRWAASLLPDTASKRASANTNLALMPVGAYLYVSDGNEVYWTADITVGSPAWTSAVIFNGEAAQSVKSITSDGNYLYAALGSNGIHRSLRGSATSAHYSDLSATLVGYVKGRLMAANGNAIYNVVASGAAPSALYTHPNTDFTWVGFAEGASVFYAAGFSGDKSLIYKTAVKPDGTALDVPTVAGELPDGEVVRSVAGYLSYIVLGTDKGVRFCGADDNGNLTIGALIPTSAPVRCFEGQDRFVWYGAENYDSTSTGLGRLDLSTFTASLTPAYASDLMAAAQGQVTSVVTFANLRVFAVSGVGIFAETTTKLATGTLDGGIVAFGLSDTKVALGLNLRHHPLDGSARAYLSRDGGSFALVGSSTELDSTGADFTIATSVAERFETRLELTASVLDATQGPVITRSTLRARPTPKRGRHYILPLLLHPYVVDRAGNDQTQDIAELAANIEALCETGRPVTLQYAGSSATVVVEDWDDDPYAMVDDGSRWMSTMTAKLVQVS